jgi:hypothetical protein
MKVFADDRESTVLGNVSDVTSPCGRLFAHTLKQVKVLRLQAGTGVPVTAGTRT